MSEALHQILTPASWPTFVYVATRVGGLMVAAPLWSISGLPRSGRAAVAILLSAALLPGVPPVDAPDQLALLPVEMGVEFLLGLFIGLTAAVLVHGLAMAGEVLSLQMGLNLAPSISPVTDVQVPGVGQLQSFLGIMIYVGVDGHLMLLEGVADSLRALPPGFGVAMDQGVSLGGLMLGTMFTAALQAAAPAMVALVVVDLAVGIVSRAVPQVQAILVLFPLTILVGLVMFGVSLPSVAEVVAGWMTELPARVAEVIGAFEPVS